MHRYLYFLIALILASCSAKSTLKKSDSVSNNAVKSLVLVTTGNTNTAKAVTNNTSEGTDEEFITYYVVVVDTGSNYYSLRNKMQSLHNTLRIEIDTMGRYFNARKNLIALPDNDADEIYAGDYFPRRTPSKTFT